MFEQWRIQILFFVGMCLTISIPGCAGGVGTTQHDGLTTEGVSYFLPRNDVRVVFTNQTIASEVKAATKKVEEAKENKLAATAAVNRAEKALAAVKPDAKPEERKKYEEDLEVSKKLEKEASAKLLGAEKDLAKKNEAKPQILVEVLPPVPDTSQHYITALDHSWFHDDTVTFKTSPEGLLTQVTYKGADRTGDIVQNLVKTGIEAAKLYARLQGVPIPPSDQEANLLGAQTRLCTEPERKDAKGNPVPYFWEFTIDPTDAQAIAKVNRKLIETPLPFLINIKKPKQDFGSPPKLQGRVPGLIYRRAIPYTVEILEDRIQKEEICRITEGWKNGSPPSPELLGDAQIKNLKLALEEREGHIPTSKSQQVLMVTGGPIAFLEFGDSNFVTNDLHATFKQGVLLDSNQVRPSELFGFSMIPLNALRAVGNAVGSVVTNIIPWKIDYTNKSKELIEAETELLKAREANAELQKQVLSQFESVDQTASGP